MIAYGIACQSKHSYRHPSSVRQKWQSVRDDIRHHGGSERRYDTDTCAQARLYDDRHGDRCRDSRGFTADCVHSP